MEKSQPKKHGGISKKQYWTESLSPQKLWAVFWIQLNEGYQINCIYPFVVFMIRDFNFNEEDVGLYAGLLTATFALTQFLSSYPWGYVSDIYGRQKALLLGLIFSGFAILVFGTSKNYYQAVIARSIAGIFNGNIGVARAYVADITNSHNRPFAFSIFAIAFSCGIVLGSSAGGSLIYTWELDEDGMHRPSEGVLKWWIFHTQFPYLLPCLFGALVSLIAFGFTVAYIKDVHNIDTGHKYEKYLPEESMGGTSETEPSYSRSRSKSVPMMALDKDKSAEWSYSNMKITKKNSYLTVVSKDDADLPVKYLGWEELWPVSLVEENTMASNSLYNGVAAFKNFNPEKDKLLEKKNPGDIQINSVRDLFRKTRIFHALVINSTIMLMLVAWNSIVPYLMAQTLEMNSTDIGIYMAWTGVMLFVFTWYVQPLMLARFNYKTMYIGFGFGMLTVILLFPSISLIPNVMSWNKYVLLALVAFVGGFKHGCATMLFVASMCFLNNSVPSSACGRANGLGQAVGSGLRGLGPLIGGILWSWSMTFDSKYAVYFAYIYMWIPSAYSVIHCALFIDRDVQKTWEERYDIKQESKA